MRDRGMETMSTMVRYSHTTTSDGASVIGVLLKPLPGSETMNHAMLVCGDVCQV